MAQRVIVIGLGCAGTAACAALAARGADVIGIDQYDIGHTHGGSAHQSRAFRLAYFEHPGYVPLLREAREAWIRLNTDADEQVFYETGGLYMGDSDGSLVPDSVAAAQAYDIPHTTHDARSIRQRWPAFDLRDDMVGMHEPLAGLIVPERALQAHASAAVANGAELQTGVKATQWREDSAGVVVDTSDGPVHADRLVLCAGAWAGPLSQCTALRIRPSRQVLVWFDAPDAAPIDAPALPVWALELDDASLLYGFPRMSGLPGPGGFKVARHWAGPTVDPDDDIAKAPQAGDERDVVPHLTRWLPSASGAASTVHTCLYANSTDGHFRIGLHPHASHVVIVAGLSGHGFKFQPVLGTIAADLALTGRTAMNINFLAIEDPPPPA